MTRTTARRRVPRVAYFCMEYALDPSLRLYCGGLGILAGDYLKGARDLRLPMVGIGLLWQQRYSHRMFALGQALGDRQRGQAMVRTVAVESGYRAARLLVDGDPHLSAHCGSSGQQEAWIPGCDAGRAPRGAMWRAASHARSRSKVEPRLGGSGGGLPRRLRMPSWEASRATT